MSPEEAEMGYPSARRHALTRLKEACIRFEWRLERWVFREGWLLLLALVGGLMAGWLFIRVMP